MQVVFDVRTAPFDSWAMFTPIGLLAVGALYEIVRHGRRPALPVARDAVVGRLIHLAALLGVMGMLGILILGYRTEKLEFIDVLNDGRARVVEGEITDYTAQGWSGRPLESFRVGSDSFWFDGFGGTAAYHRRTRRGGGLSEGQTVRIHEYSGNILRVELLPPGAARGDQSTADPPTSNR
ncbi:MAG: hypothetical protein KA761_12795 [Gemmatimonadaceae bacterium]|nr:hypothetical protein [Gemmatimonadaceae bacterium]